MSNLHNFSISVRLIFGTDIKNLDSHGKCSVIYFGVRELCILRCPDRWTDRHANKCGVAARPGTVYVLWFRI